MEVGHARCRARDSDGRRSGSELVVDFSNAVQFCVFFIFRSFFKQAFVIAEGVAAPAELNKERRAL